MLARFSTAAVLSLVAYASLLTTGATAAPVTVTNHSFEDVTGEPGLNEFTFGPPPGWSLYESGAGGFTSDGDGPSYYVGTLTPQPNPATPPNFWFFPAGAPDGQRVAIAYNLAATGGGGAYGLQQTLAATLQPNTTYTLKVDVGNIASGNDAGGTVYNLNGFPGYRVELLAGGTVIKQDDNTLAATLAEGTFATSTVSFTTGAAHDQMNQPLGIRLINLNVVDANAPTADLEVDFDNVRLDAVAVPEPTSLLGATIVILAATCSRGQRTVTNVVADVTGAGNSPSEPQTPVKMSP